MLTIDTCDKEARFIRFCDCFNIPLIFLVDTVGFVPSVEDERSRDGLIRTAARPVFAICEATVPRVVVYLGKCFGTARLMMGTPRMGVNMVFSWPSGQVARMEPEDLVGIIYKEEIEGARDPDAVRGGKRGELLEQYLHFPYHAAEQLMVNDIIDPRDTRPVLIRALDVLDRLEPDPRPWKKHSLIPR